MKRLCLAGLFLQVHRSKDETYCYTNNPSDIHHKSNKIEHHLKIVDFYINEGMPSQFLVEPSFGTYNPDILYRDKRGQIKCVEIQLTPISQKKMQQKINQFVAESGRNHNSKCIVICSNKEYKRLTIPDNFTLLKQKIPPEIVLK